MWAKRNSSWNRGEEDEIGKSKGARRKKLLSSLRAGVFRTRVAAILFYNAPAKLRDDSLASVTGSYPAALLSIAPPLQDKLPRNMPMMLHPACIF
jgi:hypothetical protein